MQYILDPEDKKFIAMLSFLIKALSGVNQMELLIGQSIVYTEDAIKNLLYLSYACYAVGFEIDMAQVKELEDTIEEWLPEWRYTHGSFSF